MEARWNPRRRRSASSHRLGTRTKINTYRNMQDHSLLQEWRHVLARVEREAALYHCAEVQTLVGAAALAVDDLLGKTQLKQCVPIQKSP